MKSLAKKLSFVLGQVSNIEKRGKNTFHGYNYVTEADALDAVRRLLAASGIFVFTSQIDVKVLGEGLTETLLVTLEHTFVDADSDDTFSVRTYGEAGDPNSKQNKRGDKALYKAYTGAMKYFIMKNFLLSTNDDPEDDHADKVLDAKPVAQIVQQKPVAISSQAKDKPSKEPTEWINAMTNIVQIGDFAGRNFDSITPAEAKEYVDKVFSYSAKHKKPVPKHFEPMVSALEHKSALAAAAEVFETDVPMFDSYEKTKI